MVTEGVTNDSVFEDSTEIYCKKLGHTVPFSYCQTDPSTGAKPGLCPHIRNCWFLRGDIDAFLQAEYTQEILNTAAEPKVPKSVSLYELIKKATEK